MKRKRKLVYNTFLALLKQVVVVCCGFVLPRYMLVYYGSEINGTISSITQLLSFIAILEMGIGPVIQSNLYRPLAENLHETISRVVKSSERFFRRIALIFILYVLVLVVVYPFFLNTEFDRVFTALLIIILSLNTLSQYYFGITYQLLLNADQKSYVQLALQTITILLNTVLSVVLIKNGFSVMFVKLVTASIYIFRPILLNLYVRRHYEIDRNVMYDEEPIKQKWNGFAQHLAAVVCGNTDVAVLTFFAPITYVSIYSVYYSVTNGVTSTVMTAVTGLEALWGNMLALGEKELLLKTFNVVEWLIHTIVTILFTITGIMLIPFVSVYTRGINDADYIVPAFGGILVLAYGFQCLRIPYFRLIKAAGHYKETQKGAIISMLLNVVISIALVSRLGLVGAGIGTLVALAYHTFYFVYYLKNHILSRRIQKFGKLLITDILIAIISTYATLTIKLAQISYYAWVMMAVKVAFVVLFIVFIINFLFHREEMRSFICFIKNKHL